MKRLVFAVFLMLIAGTAVAQRGYPAKPVRLIVGDTSGGATGIVARLHTVAVRALAAPDVREKLNAQGAVAIGSTPGKFRAPIRAEIGKWGQVVRTSGARVD